MTTNPETSPVSISCDVARFADGEPALTLDGKPIFVMRCAHLDTGAVLTAEVPAGSQEAIGAVGDMGAQILQILGHALADLNGGGDV